MNTAGWDKAWTNLVNDVEQTFMPSLDKLMHVWFAPRDSHRSGGGGSDTVGAFDGKVARRRREHCRGNVK